MISGLFNPDVLRQARLNQAIEDQLYPSIETEAEEQGACSVNSSIK